MNEGKYVFSQLISFCSHNDFRKCVDRHNGDLLSRKFRSWHHFLCLAFGQLTGRQSLRDIIVCLNAHQQKLYHLGLPKNISRSTFSDANASRDWRIFADFAKILMKQAMEIYQDSPDFVKELTQAIYALDASVITLSLRLLPWEGWRKAQSALKIHAMLDVHSAIPSFFALTSARTDDKKIFPQIHFEPGCFYVMDRGYFSVKELDRIHNSRAWFVIRTKRKVRFQRIRSLTRIGYPAIRLHQKVQFEGRWARKYFTQPLRLIKSKDMNTGKTISILTNNFELDPQSIADIYRQRWKIELFFKWIKQHLKIKVFWGQNTNSIQIQIWSALATYILVAIMKKKLSLPQNLYEILQILSVSAFSKEPLNQLFTKSASQDESSIDPNQLTLF